MLVDGQEGGARVDPGAGVVILDAVAHKRECSMGVAAEDALTLAEARIVDGAAGHFVGEAQPARVRAVEKT